MIENNSTNGTIEFFATVGQVTGGDDEVRAVLSVKDTPADHAAAVAMFGRLNRILHVAAYVGTGTEAIAEFRAAIPRLQTAIQFRPDRPPVIKLDIPATDGLQALRLIGYNEQLMRFVIQDDGQREQSSRARKPEREHGAFGDYWAIVKGQRQIQNWPDVLEWLGIATPAEAEVKLREVFGVEHMDFVSPEQAEQVFGEAGLASVITMLRQAETQWREQQVRKAAEIHSK